MDAEHKERILERVRAWLDAWRDDEPFPDELDPTLAGPAPSDPRTDLASLVAAVTACTREVQIQGRTFKRLEQQVEPVAAGFPRLLERTEAVLAQGAATQPAGGTALLELHDRLSRCVAEARKAAAAFSWFARRGAGAAAHHALVDGLVLVLARVEEVLAADDILPIETTGRTFDPRTMRAIDSVPAGPDRRAGHVVETLRAGFMSGERVLRPAEVRVAR